MKQRLEESGEKPPELATDGNPHLKKVWVEEDGGYTEVVTPESCKWDYLNERETNEIFYWDYHLKYLN